MKSFKPLVILFTICCLLTAVVMPALAAEQNKKSLTTSGEATIQVKPEKVEIYLTVQAQGKTAQDAQKNNAQQMNNVWQKMHLINNTKTKMETVSFNLYPLYDYKNNSDSRKIVGYQTVNQIKIETKELDQVGNIVDTAIAAGVNEVNNIVYSVEDEDKWTLQALEKATLQAKKKANVMAKTLGVTIKGINALNEQNARVMPVAYLAGSEMFRKNADTTTIEAPKNIEIRASIFLDCAI